jgi:nitroreductase
MNSSIEESEMIDILRNRRSVRVYEDRAVEDDKVQTLKEALVRSPSSRSFNPWEFILLEDKQTLAELARCKPHGASFLAGASLAVVVIGNTEKSDTCIEDCSIAAITLQYTAESLGLSSCWCQVRLRSHDGDRSSEEYVRGILGIPANYLVECMIGIGYPGEEKSPHSSESLDWDKIRSNRF